MTPMFLERLKERKLFQWALAYLAGAWLILQVLGELNDAYDWPPAVMRSVPVLLGIGLLVALVLAWYHGEKGQQRATGPELLMLGALLVIAGAAVTFVGRSGDPERQAATVASALPPPPAEQGSIAVLPFTNLSADPEQEYFSDGITEDILGKLSRIEGMRVTSRTSVMSYKGTKKPLREISQELGVSHVLEGSVRRAGDRLRINVQLVNARTDQSLWSETYDRDVTDVFAVQSEIAERIAGALQVRLTAGARARMGQGGTETFAAYDLYLKGRELLFRDAPGVAERQAQVSGAIALFRQALELDPDYALAYAGLAWGYEQHPDLTPALRLDSSVVFSREAIRRAPDLPQGYTELGWTYISRWELELAAEQFQRALQLDPNHVDAVRGLAQTQERRGRYAEALRHMKRAASLEPARPEFASGVARIYERLGDFAAAEKWYRRAFFELRPNPQRGHCSLAWLAYHQGNRPRVHHHLQQMLAAGRPGDFAFQCAGALQLALGNHTAARQYLERYAASAPEEDDPYLLLAYLAMKAGNRARADALFRQAEKFAQQRQEICGGRCASSRLARIRAVQGRSEEAINYVRRAVETGWTGPYPTAPDPLLASIADDPRYRQIIAGIKAHRDRERARVEREGW